MGHEKKIIIALAKEKSPRQDCNLKFCFHSVERALRSLGFSTAALYLEEKDFRSNRFISEKIRKFKPFCVFNLFEGFAGDSKKEAAFARILEVSKIPFTGNNSHALRTCLNKDAAKRILLRERIAVPKGFTMEKFDRKKLRRLKFPIFVKPVCEDASLGIDRDSLISDIKKAPLLLKNKLKVFPKGFIAEEYIGGKEYSLGFLGSYPYELVGVSVIEYKNCGNLPAFLTYNSKWKVSSKEYKKIMPRIACNLPRRVKAKIIAIASRAAKALKCRSYFRVDIREKDGYFYVLDVNPNPDINTDSGFMKQVYARGWTYRQAIEKIVNLAKTCRIGRK